MRKLFIFLLCAKTCLCGPVLSEVFADLQYNHLKSKEMTCLGLEKVAEVLGQDSGYYDNAKTQLELGRYRKFGTSPYDYFCNKLLLIAAMGTVLVSPMDKAMGYPAIKFHQSILEDFPNIEEKFIDLTEIIKEVMSKHTLSEVQLEKLNEILNDFWYLVISDEMTVRELITGIGHVKPLLLRITQPNIHILKIQKLVDNLNQRDYFDLLRALVFNIKPLEFMTAPEDNMFTFVFSSTPHKHLFGFVSLYRKIFHESSTFENVELHSADLIRLSRGNEVRKSVFMKSISNKIVLDLIHANNKQRSIQILKDLQFIAHFTGTPLVCTKFEGIVFDSVRWAFTGQWEEGKFSKETIRKHSAEIRKLIEDLKSQAESSDEVKWLIEGLEWVGR